MDTVNQKRLVKSKSGLKIVPSDINLRSPFELGEPEWVPDEKSPDCTHCHTKFDFITRRHHCRRCGQVYCNSCCLQRVPVRRMCFVDPVRLCESCIQVTQRENDFYDKHLKALATGANFHLTSVGDGSAVIPFFCRLSSDHREIIFDGGSVFHHEPLPLQNVTAIKLVRTTEFTGENEIGGAKIVYMHDNQARSMSLRVAPVPNHRHSTLWIVGLKKAMKLLKESRFQEDWSSSFPSSINP